MGAEEDYDSAQPGRTGFGSGFFGGNNGGGPSLYFGAFSTPSRNCRCALLSPPSAPRASSSW